MRTLIAVVNARSRDNWRNAVRSSWLSQVPNDKADAFFFVGRGAPISDLDHVVELDCSDNYEHLPEKVRAISRWALSKGYDYMLKCDDDVILRPKDWLVSGYDRQDYTGRSNRPESPYAIPMGFNYVMSKRCMEIIAVADLPGDGSLDDERWCAYNLSVRGINLTNDNRYFLWQTMLPREVPARPLRAPKRPVIDTSLWGPRQADGTFSWCVHINDVAGRIDEFKKIFDIHGEK